MDLWEEHIRNIMQDHFKVNRLEELQIKKVEKLDSPSGYFLASFKAPAGTGYHVAIVDEVDNKVVQSALVQRVDDLNVEDKLRELGIENDAAVRLVWKPSKLSFSPFYPFYEVKTVDDTFYINQEGKQFKDLLPGRG